MKSPLSGGGETLALVVIMLDRMGMGLEARSGGLFVYFEACLMWERARCLSSSPG